MSIYSRKALTPAQLKSRNEEILRDLEESGEGYERVGRRHGVSGTTVWNLVKRKK
jgi:hypothetical protein